MYLRMLDSHLLADKTSPKLTGLHRFAVEFFYFGIKEARACLFVALFFAAIFTVPRGGFLGIPRYDALLLIALGIQAWMLWMKLETLDELKAICLFHVIGFALEAFKTSSSIQAWSYPILPTPRSRACRCFPALCMLPSAATSSRLGACSTSASSTTPNCGWQV